MRAQVVQPDGFVYDRCEVCGGLWLPLQRIHVLLKELGVTDADTTQEAERLEAQVEKAQEAADAAKAARQTTMGPTMDAPYRSGSEQDWGMLWGVLEGIMPVLMLARMLLSWCDAQEKRERDRRRYGRY